MLAEIVRSKQAEVARAKEQLPLEDLKQRVAHYQPAYSFAEALHTEQRINLIAELKRKSPSKGMLRERFDPVRLAQELQEAGATALSVLTDEPFFGGSLQYMRDVSAFTEIPRLRKDFILDPYQVYEAALYGADAVLLIVRLLDDVALRACLETAHELGMDALVEVHADAELPRALAVGARIIGVNHRDLDTLQLDMNLSERILKSVPSGKIMVAESGIHTAEDVVRMQALGVHALLIGEAIMLCSDVQQKVRDLFSAVWNNPKFPEGP